MISMKDEWNTGIKEEIWDIRPKEERLERECEPGEVSPGVWRNSFGQLFREGDEITIKTWSPAFRYQTPSYTREMRNEWQGAKRKIFKIHSYYSVSLENTGYTWNLDWLIAAPPPLEDDLFDI